MYFVREKRHLLENTVGCLIGVNWAVCVEKPFWLIHFNHTQKKRKEEIQETEKKNDIGN